MIHTGPIKSLKVNTDGKYVFTAGYDKKVIKWNIKTGESSLITKHNHLLTGVDVTKDGQFLVTSSADYTLKLINLKTNEITNTYLGHCDDVESFILSDDDKYIISTSNQHDGRVIVWELESGKIVNEFKEHKNSVKSIWTYYNTAFSSDNDGNVYVWELNTGKLLHNLGPFSFDIDTIAGSVEDKMLLLGLDNGEIIIINPENFTEINRYQAHDIGIKKITISPKGNYILTAAYDHQIKLWDKDFNFIKSLTTSNYQWEVTFDWTPDEKYVLGGSFGRKYMYWDIENNKLIDTGENSTPSINDISISNSSKIVTASDDGYFRINGDIINKDNQILTNAVGINNSGNIAVWGNHEGKIFILDLENKKIVKILNMNTGPINTIKFDLDDLNFYVGTYGGFIHKINMHTLNELDSFKAHEGAIKGLHVSNDFLFSSSTGGKAYKFDKTSYTLINDYKGSQFIVNDISYNETLDWVVTVSRDKFVRIFNAENGKLLHFHNLHNYSIKSVVINNNGIIYSGDYWGYVVRWNPKQDKIEKIKVGNNGISCLDNNNDSVIAGSYDGAIYNLDEQDPTISYRLFTQ